MRLPSDRGLEIVSLFETLRHRAPVRVCQVEIAERYEHKHCDVSPQDATAGLNCMARDIGTHLLRTAGLPSARLLAAAAQGGLVVLFVAMALEHLGVGRQVILTAFTIAFGGLVLALALAFGLAGRDLARELLERLARRPPTEDQRRHL